MIIMMMITDGHKDPKTIYVDMYTIDDIWQKDFKYIPVSLIVSLQ